LDYIHVASALTIVIYILSLEKYKYNWYNVTIAGYGNDINIPANSENVFRADNTITINGNFSLPLGSSLELITHPCPQ